MQNYPAESVLFLQIQLVCVSNYFKVLLCGSVSPSYIALTGGPERQAEEGRIHFLLTGSEVSLWSLGSTAVDLIRQHIKTVSLRLFILEIW